jgi:thiaminase
VSEVDALIRGIREDLRPVESKIASHPYIEALREGRVERDRLRIFAGEQHHIIRSDLRSFALLVSRYGADAETRGFLSDTMQGEVAALDALSSFAGALGMDEDALESYEPLPGAHAYAAYVAWLAAYGSPAEVAGAFLVNLEAWGANCGAMSRALQERYGFDRPQVAFFDMFSSTPEGFEEAAIRLVARGLERGVEPRAVRRAARLLQGYELMYWDTLHQASTS